MSSPLPAAPAMVFAEVGAAINPVEVTLSVAMFIVASFAVANLAVRMIWSVAPETVKNALTSVSAANAARIFPATTDAVSLLATATFRVLGLLVMPAAVTVTFAFPAPVGVIVPTTVAVSTCCTPPSKVRPLKFWPTIVLRSVTVPLIRKIPPPVPVALLSLSARLLVIVLLLIVKVALRRECRHRPSLPV